MEESILTAPRTVILYDKEKISAPDSSLFDFETNKKKASSNELGRGSALMFSINGIDVVLKHYRRGGLFGKLIKNRYRYSGIDNTRMFQEFRLLSQMKELELPVPSPIAAQAVKYGLSYSGDLITERVPNARTLAEKLLESQLNAEIWQNIGRTIQLFHKHNIYHADLNANNIMLDEEDKVFLIDFDKSKIISANNGWKEKNVARLLRSLKKIKKNNTELNFDLSNFDQLLKGYGQ